MQVIVNHCGTSVDTITFRGLPALKAADVFKPDSRGQQELSRWLHRSDAALVGQEVASLVSAYQNPGSHTVVWNGKNNEGISVAGGIYIYRLTAGDFVQTRKMVLLK